MRNARARYELTLRVILLTCVAGILALVLAQVFAAADVPLAVLVGGGVNAVWIAFLEPRLRARAPGRSQVRGMAEGLVLAVAASLVVSVMS